MQDSMETQGEKMKKQKDVALYVVCPHCSSSLKVTKIGGISLFRKNGITGVEVVK